MTSAKRSPAVRPGLVVAGATLLGVSGLATAGAIMLGAAGYVPPFAAGKEGIVSGLTFDRAWISVVAFLALAGAVIGGLALIRSAGRSGTGSRGAVVALVVGPVGVAGGVSNLALADGGPGTGNGVVGGGVALLMGLIAIVLGWLTRARTRRAG